MNRIRIWLEAINYLIITQDNLIKQIAKIEDVDVATVRRIFNATENVIFDHLSSIAPSKNLLIKVLSGISIERSYVQKKKYSKGMFKNIECPAHIKIKGDSSKYFAKRVNDALIEKKLLN